MSAAAFGKTNDRIRECMPPCVPRHSDQNHIRECISPCARGIRISTAYENAYRHARHTQLARLLGHREARERARGVPLYARVHLRVAHEAHERAQRAGLHHRARRDDAQLRNVGERQRAVAAHDRVVELEAARGRVKRIRECAHDESNAFSNARRTTAMHSRMTSGAPAHDVPEAARLHDRRARARVHGEACERRGHGALVPALGYAEWGGLHGKCIRVCAYSSRGERPSARNVGSSPSRTTAARFAGTPATNLRPHSDMHTTAYANAYRHARTRARAPHSAA